MLLPCAQLAALVLLALSLWTLGALAYLAPYKRVLLHLYAFPALMFLAVVYANLVAGLYVLARALTRSHMGQRLQHVERELRAPARTVNPGLTKRLRS